jgi:hypothetical protein
MTLDEQTSLIDQMIHENPDYTIRDFLNLKAEIESVESSMKIKHTHFIFHQTTSENDHHRKAYAPLRLYSR